MAEATPAATTITEEKVPGKLASAGKPVAGKPVINQPKIETPQDDNDAASAKNTGTKPPADEGVQLPNLTPEQIKELFSKQGIEFDGNFESLKQKIQKADTPPPIELTEEEKKAATEAHRKRMLDLYLKNGGKIEDFVAVEKVASIDLRELSESEIRRELKEEGFDEEQISAVLRERYYQINLEELVQSDDESDEDFNKRKEISKKKAVYGSKKLENRSSHIKKQAADILRELEEAIKTEELLQAKEKEFVSNVEDFSKKIPKTVKFELGESNDKKIDPVEFTIPDEDIAEVMNDLKDPAKRKQILLTEDNTLNIAKVTDMMLRNKYLEKALKAAYLVGGDRQVDEFKKVFPDSPYAIGVGGQGAGGGGRKGQIVSAGKPQVAVPQNN